MASTLSAFKISPAQDGYLLEITQEDGETLSLVASYDQLDLMAEAIDDLLDRVEEDELQVGADNDADGEQ